DDFVAVKTETTDVPDAAEAFSPIARTQALGGILDHWQRVFRRDFKDRIQVNGMAKNVDRQDGLHAPARPLVAQFLAVPAAVIFEKIDDSRRAHLPVSWLCIDEDRPSANVANCVSGGDECER